MKTRVVKVDAKKASELLATSPGNRPIRKSVVRRYAKEMQMNTWPLTPEPIVINERGQLVNGHHRLHAVILSGCTVEFFLADGFEHKHVQKLDGGQTRTLGDRFYAYNTDRTVKRLVNGHPSKAKQVASIASFIYNMLVGEKNPSVEEATRIVRHFSDSIDVVLGSLSADPLMRKASIFSAFVVAHCYAETKVAQNSVINLMEATKSGEMLERGEPGYTLRGYYLGIKKPRGKKGAASTDSQWIIFIKTLRAIQAEQEGERITKLQTPRGGSRQLIEWFIGETAALAKQLRLGTKEMRRALEDEGEEEEE